MYIENLVIDDLREFDPPRENVTYCRTLASAMALLDEYQVEIENLWLDFDLGGDDTAKPFVRGLIGATIEGTPKVFKWTIQNIYITTANPVGRKDLYELTSGYIPASIQVVDPVTYGLVNKVKW